MPLTLNPFPRTTQVKVMRHRVHQHDLDMYAAISGRPSGVPEQAESIEKAVEVATAARAKPWSVNVLATYLGNLSVPRIAVRVVRPEVADWVRRMSSCAIERLQEAQERLANSRETVGTSARGNGNRVQSHRA